MGDCPNRLLSSSAEPEGVAPSALDAGAALARAGGDPRLLGELADMFIEDSDRWLADLAEGLGRGDAARVEFSAHLLRGSAANFGAQGACRAARELEEAALGGDLGRVAAHAPVLEDCLRALRPALAALARAARETPA
jgi:HPt (histidine-containing phosphotransfer) domain-containing protein